MSVERLVQAIPEAGVEALRPLLPSGYPSVADAYRRAANSITTDRLSTHYSGGLRRFHDVFVPYVKDCLSRLTGGAFALSRFRAFAAGSDVDLMAHIVEAVAAREAVHLYPGDWFGFRVGCTQTERIAWSTDGRAALACLCVPSVRNGHLTQEMLEFLGAADACLLNINLLPTLSDEERVRTAKALVPLLPRSILSVSFSRGFGMTASQLGLILVHEDHPLLALMQTQWEWLTYFYNAFAADTFMQIDVRELQAIDQRRRRWVREWITTRGLPWLDSGTYYVRSFRPQGRLPSYLAPLQREDVVRLCMKPPM